MLFTAVKSKLFPDPLLFKVQALNRLLTLLCLHIVKGSAFIEVSLLKFSYHGDTWGGVSALATEKKK